MEDLGCRDPNAMSEGCSTSMAVPDDLAMPGWLKAYNEQVRLL